MYMHDYLEYGKISVNSPPLLPFPPVTSFSLYACGAGFSLKARTKALAPIYSEHAMVPAFKEVLKASIHKTNSFTGASALDLFIIYKPPKN